MCSTAIFVTWAIAVLPAVHAYSLNLMKNHCVREDKKCSLKFEDYILKHFLKSSFHQSHYGEETLKVIHKNPCTLTKITSHFEIHKLEIIVDQKLYDFEKSLAEFEEIIYGNIEISVSLIQGDENDINNLRRTLLQFLTRKTRCIIVLCKKCMQ